MISLDDTLSRIAQIESMLSTAQSVASSALSSATSAAGAGTGATSSTDFATMLQNASATPSAATETANALSGTTGATSGLSTSTDFASLASSNPQLASALSSNPQLASALSAYTGGAGLSTGVVGTAALSGATDAPATAATTGGSAYGNAIVQIAQSQVGQGEQPPGSNDGPAIAMYRTATQGAQAGEPWCAYFASWAARQAGEPIGSQGQGLGYVGDIWNWAQQTGRAIPNGQGVVPQPGDLIVFGTEHVGIVKQVLPNGDIETIEGNYDNQVENVIRSPTEATGYVQM